VTELGAAELAGLARLASSVAQEAAALLLAGRGDVQVVAVKSSPTDVVTAMDKAAEKLIRDRLLTARPGDAILGEEQGETGHGRTRWIVDPLDGTVNYLYGLPDWSVSIAAEVNGEIVAGAVAVPMRRELFTATRGGGAWLHADGEAGQTRLACNTEVALADALVSTGFAYLASHRASQGAVTGQLVAKVRDIRRAGSEGGGGWEVVADLCNVAAGRVDAYYEQGVHYWDVAAGGLIAAEAGATMAGLHGQPAGEALTIAAGPGLFGQLHDLLALLNADRIPPD
jgi:myo-inositol-1(or 4)-monophosphatase